MLQSGAKSFQDKNKISVWATFIQNRLEYSDYFNLQIGAKTVCGLDFILVLFRKWLMECMQ